ncbi:MAG: MlaE family lipid ABC transporter permease subunit [Sulfurimonas sp.]|uniref:MlaE family lipid ABC transporter permease subunit n=1 Tax=Sulfurimonas sp. TaxID=2022749 RepID=UPI0026069D1D|nr:MlaE family lipid ABC transporter permease subunit [Sulfurimonas sp.]MDD5372074.1 MlaE family lipid ABC transporter permease subunit [Sulfurimonas sp.]
MNNSSLDIILIGDKLSLKFKGELTLYNLTKHKKRTDSLDLSKVRNIVIDLSELSFLDSAASIFINNLQNRLSLNSALQVELFCDNTEVLDMLELVREQKLNCGEISHRRKRGFLEKLGENTYKNYISFLSFMSFMGELFANKMHYIESYKNIRYKEIAFEINECAIKAFGIVALTSFLIGLVVAYQSAYQLKLYGANIFIVDMLGISVLRELSPLITAIVIAGRSGSAFTAQIGAMKITQELDAMQTMGFDPYKFLVIPKIAALMITLPILIFISDIMAVIGGIVVANLDLGITVDMFLDRFSNVVGVKHFVVGIVKGPFFAFLIASIAIYRGLLVRDDTQSIGFNTTKSVVESIFAVIICDAVFSIAFTNLGI